MDFAWFHSSPPGVSRAENQQYPDHDHICISDCKACVPLGEITADLLGPCCGEQWGTGPPSATLAVILAGRWILMPMQMCRTTSPPENTIGKQLSSSRVQRQRCAAPTRFVRCTLWDVRLQRGLLDHWSTHLQWGATFPEALPHWIWEEHSLFSSCTLPRGITMNRHQRM